MPLLSIITPCYNDGIYLDDAFDSIELDKYKDIFEHIIINDGSTDPFTLQKLEELAQKGSKVIHQQNKGLGAARNTGIDAARGKYILPLDADNKLIPSVFLECFQLMENDSTIDVVYTDARLFGDRQDIWKVGDFDIFKLLCGNYIDACALVKTSVIKKLGKYDEGMPAMGNEDWELWIKIALNQGKFYYYPKIGFAYRVRSNSMVRETTIPNYIANRNYVFDKYHSHIADQYCNLYKLSNKQSKALENIKKSTTYRIGYYLLYPFKSITTFFSS